MANIPVTGYIPVTSDRYLEPIRVTRLSDGKLETIVPYVVRVGLVDTPHQLRVSMEQDNQAMKDAWNSVFYAINQGMDGEVNPVLVPYGMTEPEEAP